MLGKVKGIREWLTDRVEQLSGQSLLNSAALTSVSPDYTTPFPYCFLLQINTNMSVFLLHALPLYLKSSKDISFAHVIFSWLLVDSCYSTEPDQVFWIVSPYQRLVPVGARQAVAVPRPPSRRHVPGPGLTSPPLLPSCLP